MRKYIFIPLFVAVLCGIAFAGVKHFWRGETMNLKQAEKRWGSESFDAQKFKTSSTNERAKMVVSIIKTKALIGKNRLEIRDLLGAQDGYYFTDMYPAYIIFEDPKSDGETWQIVGLLDKEYKVKEVIIHKNCCNK
ncbi:MAG: hypothetical protein J7501_03030 [Bdellovibrio sp.]|nr:hypothetical protein [Bdellovibrio sp.]